MIEQEFWNFVEVSVTTVAPFVMFMIVVSLALKMIQRPDFNPPPKPSIRPSLWQRFIDGLYIRYYAAISRRRNRKGMRGDND